MSKHQSSSSSQIPILPPLPRRYHNLPAPVIHPPGSGPCIFMNPNPTTSSMDVDPCVVASRGETVAKAFELTASEHAGVSLIKATTRVSPASDYRTNSPVVAPQTVNDLLVSTKTESKNTNCIGYDVCNVTCNTEMTFKKHMEGKIDLKNAQKPSPEKKNQDLDITHKLLVSTAVEQETQSSVANDALDQASEKKNRELLQKTADFRSLFVCDIPEPGVDYSKIVTVEMDESLFKNGVPNPTSTSRTSVQPSNIDTQNRPAKCFDKRVAYEQHKKNLNISAKTLTPPVKWKWCDICKVTCTGNDYDKHQFGKKHIKNLKKVEKIPNSPSPSTVFNSVTARLAENLKLTKGEVVNPNEGNSTRCELCRVCCNSTDLLNRHILGKKHQKNLKRSEKQCVISPACVTKTPSPEPMIEEDEIVVSERSKRKANDSSASEEDTDNTKRQKMNEEEGCVLVICKGCNVVCNGLVAYKTHNCRL